MLGLQQQLFDVYRIQRSHFALAYRALGYPPAARAPDHPRTGSGARGSTAQQDRLIGEHHQHQPQWRITWTDEWWQNRGKDRASLRVEEIVQQSLPEGNPFTQVPHLGSRCRHGGLLGPPEVGDQASQAEIPQVCRSDELPDGEGNHRSLKQDCDAQH